MLARVRIPADPATRAAHLEEWRMLRRKSRDVSLSTCAIGGGDVTCLTNTRIAYPAPMTAEDVQILRFLKVWPQTYRYVDLDRTDADAMLTYSQLPGPPVWRLFRRHQFTHSAYVMLFGRADERVHST